jgi:hypothetical protein
VAIMQRRFTSNRTVTCSKKAPSSPRPVRQAEKGGGLFFLFSMRRFCTLDAIRSCEPVPIALVRANSTVATSADLSETIGERANAN